MAADLCARGEHQWVNYGRRGAPRTGCFVCGCTPEDPRPEAVQFPRPGEEVRCECPVRSIEHAAGYCDNLASRTVRRAGHGVLRLCSSCHLSGDVWLDEPTVCEDCGEEGGNHAADCWTWGEV